MNPLQQMNLARLDHQERLERAQRALLVSESSAKGSAGLFRIIRRKAALRARKQVNVQCDAVAVN